jgi:hypothetical protein
MGMVHRENARKSTGKTKPRVSVARGLVEGF